MGNTKTANNPSTSGGGAGGEGSTFNSATGKQLQELNKINCHAEFISASSHHQAITTPEKQSDHGEISPVARFRNKFGMTSSSQAKISNSQVFLSLLEAKETDEVTSRVTLLAELRLGEGLTFNSTTAKQIQEQNKINCHAESKFSEGRRVSVENPARKLWQNHAFATTRIISSISASSNLQAVTTPEIPNDHLQEHTGGQILKQVQDDDVACGRIKKVVSAHCSQNVGCAGVRTLLSLYYCCSAKKLHPTSYYTLLFTFAQL